MHYYCMRATALLAASDKSAAAAIGSPLSSSVCLATSAFVPAVMLSWLLSGNHNSN